MPAEPLHWLHIREDDDEMDPNVITVQFPNDVLAGHFNQEVTYTTRDEVSLDGNLTETGQAIFGAALASGFTKLELIAADTVRVTGQPDWDAERTIHTFAAAVEFTTGRDFHDTVS